MERPPTAMLRIGEWCFNPASGELSRDGEAQRLDARTSRLLLCLAERPGEVVSIDELLNRAWAGVSVSSDSVYQAVTSLRRQLGDDPKKPSYIETVPRLNSRPPHNVLGQEKRSRRSEGTRALQGRSLLISGAGRGRPDVGSRGVPRTR